MIRRYIPLTCAAFLLAILFFPTAAQLQEQAPDTGFSAKEPAEQEQGELIMPAGQGGSDTSEDQVKAPPPAAPARQEQDKYIIKKGDTLWDISNAFYKDPFLWPLLWKANPYITNPDLIYPGNKLAIPSLAPIERAMEKPAERKAEEKLPEETGAGPLPGLKPKPQPKPVEVEEETPARPRIILPEEAAIPLIDKYAMLSAGFITQEEVDDKIIGSDDTVKTLFGYADVVYIKIAAPEGVNIGDKFLIYAPLNKVKHPKTGETYGRLIKGIGILQVTAKEKPDVFTAKITLSFDAIEKGSRVTPYQEPSLIYRQPQERKKDISGYVLEVRDGRTINAQTDIVYLDQGSADGLEPGDRLNVYLEREDSELPRKLVGEVQVFIVKENTATAVVRKSTDTLAKGDMIESVDALTSPPDRASRNGDSSLQQEPERPTSRSQSAPTKRRELLPFP
jgi:LysM repeat protein